MSPLIIGLIGIIILFALMAIGIPIGFSMIIMGFLGYAYITTWGAALSILGQAPYAEVANYTLSVIPLFVLMGQFTFFSGLSTDMYKAAHKLIGQLRGGLAMATIMACACFAATCGSTVATASTMGTVALPEMKKYNYNPGLATGAVSVGGTLGILIPPSTGFIVYALLTSQSIGKLFIAGILPGILLTLLLMGTVYILCRANPSFGPAALKSSFKEKLSALKIASPILLLFVLVMGGIYFGIFTANEAGGIGAFGAFVLFIIKGKNLKNNFFSALSETAQTTAMVFIIVLGALIFGRFLAISNFTTELAAVVGGFQVSRYIVLAMILVMYLFLGCVMDSLAMILITLPIIYPLIVMMGFDSIWFGVIVILICEMGLITPPIGINVFVVKGVAPEVPLEVIFRGNIPFLIALIVCVIILIAFPQIALVLPNLMM